MIPLTPTPEALGQRLDAWLSSCYPTVSKVAIRECLKVGALCLNGHPCAKGDRVQAVTYTLAYEPQDAALLPNPALAISIVHEDEALLAVNKPAAMDCQPNHASERDTLANALLAREPSLAGIGDSALTCGILHRIDHDTSGLVLVAKTQAVYEHLRAQFAARTVEKHYLALVSGTLRKAGHLEHALAHNPRCPGRMIDAAQWKDAKRPMRAVTDYRPLRQLICQTHPMTLLDVTIFTGVTHQIRAQLSFSGAPIVGDKRYGGLQLKDFHRHFLHAHTATFMHPISGERLTLTAPLTEDLQALLTP